MKNDKGLTKFAGLFLLSLFLVLSQPVFGQDENLLKSKELPTRNQSPLELTFPLKEVARVNLETRLTPQLIVSQNIVYGLSQNGLLFGYDFQEQRLLWTYKLSSPAQTSLILSKGSLYLVDEENNLVKVSQEGKLIHRESLNLPVAGQLQLWEESLILATTDNRVICLNLESVDLVWEAKVDSPVRAPFLLLEAGLIAVTSSGSIYLIFPDGNLKTLGSVGKKIVPYAYYQDGHIFLGTEDKHLLSWEVKKRRISWSMKLAAQVAANPLGVGKNLYALAANAVIYCFNLKTGEIRWWHSVPSRLALGLLPAGEAILVATANSPLLCFDLKTGKELGRYEVEGEIASPAKVVAGRLALATYQPSTGQGYLIFLEPEVELSLVPSLPSPQKLGIDLTFTAQAIGFNQPRFEFFLEKEGKRQVVQKESERATWSWIPLGPGNYVVGVKAKDKKKTKETSLSFEILKDTP